MTIFLKTLKGENLDFKVDPSDTIEDFKVMIWDKTGTYPNDLRLIFAGK